MSTELDAHLEDLRIKSKKKYRDDIWNTLFVTAIGAALAYWAYETLAHTALFAFLSFNIVAVGNRISGELMQWRAKIEANQLMDRLGM
ncbi:hypothetical protein RWK44_32720 [Rhizobium sp. 25PS6]|uniref:hypothetical protein n=1 Tax=Rhizobium sp. 25PS6 TaxID=3075622 RepID=UPI0028FD593A|nr:hypothetical protein [Rhizobium sp. 25PS6]MDU0365135.1 hypothetical protein [Rhizobium sp. 25PS6]